MLDSCALRYTGLPGGGHGKFSSLAPPYTDGAPFQLVGAMQETRINPRAPYIVQADPLLKPLIPDYLAKRRGDLQRLDDALGRKDFTALRKLGHDMFGSGGAYGLPPISEFGRQIEAAAQAADAAAIRATTADLREFLDAVKLPP